MALFRRRKRDDDETEPASASLGELFGQPDPADPLPGLRDLVTAEYAKAGVTGEVSVDPDDPLNTRLRSDRGEFVYGNVLISCLASDPRQWPTIVQAHVQATLVAPAPPDLRSPEGRATLRARLMSAEIARTGDLGYARPFAPGIIEVLNVDTPASVMLVPGSALAGLDLASLVADARANLALEEVDRVSEVSPGIHLAEGASLFVASQLLNPEFGRQNIGQPEGGFVFAIPDRHLLFWHEVAGPSSVDAINRLIGIVRGLPVEERPGGLLSHDLFYTDGATVQQITALGPDGQVQVHVEGSLMAALNG